MSHAALSRAGTYAQVRVHEPLGERTFNETPTIGGAGADIVIPGVADGAVIQVDRRNGVWVVEPLREVGARFDARAFVSARDLRRNDVIALGCAHIVVTELSRTLLRLEVCHLEGNATVPPTQAVSPLAEAEADNDVLIEAPEPPAAVSADVLAPAGSRPARSRMFRLTAFTAAVAALGCTLLAMFLNSVALDITPGDARIRVPHTLVAIHLGARLLVLAGTHRIVAEHPGYVPGQTQVTVQRNRSAIAHLTLAKLPGTLHVDTAGVAAAISVDGIDVGHAPGDVTVAAGDHTIVLRAPRYVDSISQVDIQGAGARQTLAAALQPSWGTLQISSIPAGAQVSVDGEEQGVTPRVVEAASGVRQVRITAPNLKSWESSVVLKAGAVLNIGPIALGQPDARLVLSSVPAGAEVVIGGTQRGRTPLTVDLPAGIQHELIVDLPGYASWTETIFAQAGKSLSVQARLEGVGAKLTVEGRPADAQLFVDGVDRGRTPLSLQLSATQHRIEVRKTGWISLTTQLTAQKGLDRTLQYDLKSEASQQVASTLYAQTGYPLRLVSLAGAARGGLQQRGGKPRRYYVGVVQVTNEQFRRFRPAHSSGPNPGRAGDRDEQPVVQVGWNEAAAFCNWLSEQDNLPPAYDRTDAGFVLHKPATQGYRLPSEAEWADAAHLSPPLHDLPGRLSEWTDDLSGQRDGMRHVIRTGDARDAAEGPRTTIGFRVVRYAE